MEAFVSGFTLLLSLIVAVGSQNAFILRQGILGQHVFLVCAVCALSDALLIGLGVAGMGVFLNQYPTVIHIVMAIGVMFLAAYGLKSLYSAWQMQHQLQAKQGPSTSLTTTLLLCLSFTWLNPLVLVDTVVIIGTASTLYQEAVWYFYYGAASGSFLFFFSLGYGAKLFSPMLARPQTWRVVELFTGLVMLLMAGRMFWQLASE